MRCNKLQFCFNHHRGEQRSSENFQKSLEVPALPKQLASGQILAVKHVVYVCARQFFDPKDAPLKAQEAEMWRGSDNNLWASCHILRISNIQRRIKESDHLAQSFPILKALIDVLLKSAQLRFISTGFKNFIVKGRI